MKIGIAGVGVVGGALAAWLEKNTAHEILKYDPGKGLSDDLSTAQALFLCVPAPTNPQTQKQDFINIDVCIAKFGKKNQRIFVRSSVLPGTCDSLAMVHGKQVYAMPEFLTERTASADFEAQGIICGCDMQERVEQYGFLQEIFQGRKDIILMTNKEAELAKYMHNGLGAVKVAFANSVADLARSIGADYNRVKRGALMTGYHNDMHLNVPGPDGWRGYGGKCFPKDVEALAGLMAENSVPNGMLLMMQQENADRRYDVEFGRRATRPGCCG